MAEQGSNLAQLCFKVIPMAEQDGNLVKLF
jgi:hypothetical protein